MSFSVHTFETNPKGNLGFAFHQKVGEGQDLYFLAKFDEVTTDPQNIAESIFGAIVDYFEESTITNAYDKFEEALKMANYASKKVAKSFNKTPEIIVAFFDFHHLYLTQSGLSEAYLVRGESVSQISEIPENSQDLFLNILSGQVAIDDVVIFASHRILRTVTANQLADMFSQQSYSDAVSALRHKLSTDSEEDTLVSVIGIGKQENPSAAGFLSKIVSKKEPVVEEAKEKKVVSENAEIKKQKSIESDTEYDEDFQDEILDDFDEEPIEEKKIKRVPSKNIFNQLKKLKFNKNLLLILGIVSVLCVVILFVKLSDFESEEKIMLRESLSISREALQQAENFLIQGERESAKEALAKAEEAAQKILKSKTEYFRSDARVMLSDIEEKQFQVENAKKSMPNLVADLGVKNDDLDAVGLLELKGNLFVHDLKKVYKTVRNHVEKGLPISEKETILAGVAREDQNSLLILTDAPRIVEYTDGLITPMRTDDENWKRGIDIKNYGRYAYILSPVENQIWKYERRRANYGAATNYSQGADLSRAVSFTIDGSIYVLSDDGTIQKIFRGEKQDYDFKDLPSVPFNGKNLKIYTNQNLDFIYVLDPNNERILVFVKNDRFAQYKKQILFDLPDARDFVVDETGQKASVVTKDKIYEFSL